MIRFSAVFRSAIKPYMPAAAFLGGFVWDAATLGREITAIDLFILLAYYLGAALILFAIGRGIEFRFSRYLNFVLQFFLGGIFSALVIFYFLSASDTTGFIVVGALVALLVGNEFLESRYSRLSLSWAMFCVTGIMFLNFALPHLFRSISPAWFYLSTAAAVGVVLFLRATSNAQKVTILPSLIIAVFITLLFFINLIPPVPLAKREMLVCRSIARTDRGYTLTVERPRRWELWKALRNEVSHRPGEKTYVFTSVFVPRGIETTIRHRWMRYGDDGWRDAGVVPFRIRGGRRDGYRGYSYKTNAGVGRWRVIAESEGGQTIGVLRFDVVEGGSFRRATLKL